MQTLTVFRERLDFFNCFMEPPVLGFSNCMVINWLQMMRSAQKMESLTLNALAAVRMAQQFFLTEVD